MSSISNILKNILHTSRKLKCFTDKFDEKLHVKYFSTNIYQRAIVMKY